jgi:arylsulfatase A-like enzyme
MGGQRVELHLQLACPGVVRVPPARFAVPVVSSPPAPSEWNVLLVSIDTLRADHLSAYGYDRPTSPNIDALTRRGLLFEHAETVQSATWPALTSLHTSLYPNAHGVQWNGHRLPEGLPTLADLLHARGFSTSAFITNMTRGRHPGFSRLFLSRDGGQVEADRRALGQAVAQLERERERRFFMWVHFLSPHADYAPPAPFDRAFTEPGVSRVKGEIPELVALRRRGTALSETDVAHVVGLYDGEIAFVDELVGLLLTALRDQGLEKRTLVVLTADHGEDLHQHNRYFFHSPSIYGSSMRIPLVLALPGVLPEGQRTDHLASLVDVAPTLLGLLGLPIPSTLQGENLLPGGRLPKRPVRPLVFGETNGRVFTARSAEWRFVFNPEGLHPEAPGGPYAIAEAELFDLVADAREERDLASSRAEVTRAFTAHVQAFRARTARKGAAAAGPDPEALEELRALGYLSR